jgi:DUF177 domain-containing protein
MTTFDLRSLSLRSGEQQLETLDLELEPLRLGGQEYRPEPAPVPARLTVSRASSGTFFELAFDLTLRGPCFRCLDEAALSLSLRGREYQAADPGDDDELQTEYLADDRLDVSGWARDAVVLALPDKILCLPECAGLCPVCGKNLNDEPHDHPDEQGDPRWAALQPLRDAE